ncbi:hypothetical protein BKA93DRAFT_925776 [Sparassis latifolia]
MSRSPGRAFEDSQLQEEEEEDEPEIPEEPEGDLFTIEGRPAHFYFYQGRYGGLSEGQIHALRPKIRAHGGHICSNEEESDTIIANSEAIEILEHKYYDSKTIYVESPKFVQLCIRTRRYQENHKRPVRKGMPGHPAGHQRTAFTARDDENLCKYIAAVIPNKEEGGRTGLEIYKRLVQWAEKPGREWVLRHTPMSWLERYKKNWQRLDPIIEQYVEENPPRADGKGLYERSRFYGKSQGGVRVDWSDDDDSLERRQQPYDDEAAEDEDDFDGRKRRRVDEEYDDSWQAGERAKYARHTDILPARVAPGPAVGPRAQSFPTRLKRRPSLSDYLDIEFEVEPGQEGSEASQVEAGRGGNSGRRQARAFNKRDLTEDESGSSSYEVNNILSSERVDPGPSGTQHTPSPSPSPQLPAKPTSIRSRSQYTAAQLRPHPVSAIAKAPQLTMSSQATLVGPAPTLQNERASTHDLDDMYDGPTQVDAKIYEQHVHARHPPQPSQRQPRSAVTLGSRANFPAAAPQRRPLFAKPANRRRINVVEPPPGVVVSPAALAPVAGPPQTFTVTPKTQAESTSGSAVPTSRVATVRTTYPLTPLRAGDVRRHPTNATATDSDTVPVPGTRASEEKDRRRRTLEAQKQTPYTPAPGTRAAATLSQLSQASQRGD